VGGINPAAPGVNIVTAMAVHAPLHPDHPVRRAAMALAVSLGLHAILGALAASLLVAAAAAARKREAETPKAVALATLDAARWEANRAFAKTFVPTAAFDRAPDDAAKPDRARFLSDRDRRVEKETVAAPAPGAPGKAAEAGPREAPRPPAAPSEPPRPRGGPALTAGSGGPAPGPAPGPAGPDLRPRPIAERPLAIDLGVKGEGGMPEINGVAVGGLTVLNAEAWRYATFFDRVGDTLYGVWRVEFLPRPPPISVVQHPRGGIARVALDVSLDGAGKAVTVSLRKSSGAADVDALLAELVRHSAPFPNVPPGLLDARGLYTDVWILALVWGRQGP
jgi:hypothetical protein